MALQKSCCLLISIDLGLMGLAVCSLVRSLQKLCIGFLVRIVLTKIVDLLVYCLDLLSIILNRLSCYLVLLFCRFELSLQFFKRTDFMRLDTTT